MNLRASNLEVSRLPIASEANLINFLNLKNGVNSSPQLSNILLGTGIAG